MFIINPNAFLLPSFGMTPFKTEFVASNHLLPEDNECENYFDVRFGKGKWHFTSNGREAIKVALKKYNLDKNSLVTILTTSENFYISSCVTLEIEKICKWNRELLPETKLVFVNHEFGYPYPDMKKLVQTGLPIIEDCCTTYFSQDHSNNVGKYGDYTVYSLPKFFPIQIGGIVVSNLNIPFEVEVSLNEFQKQYIRNVLSQHLKNESQLLEKRSANFQYALSKFSKIGFTERFSKDNKVVPYSMLLNNNEIIKNLNAFKLFMSNNGIQSSIFYGEDAFFIPNHQSLSLVEIDFLFETISYYINICNE